nr:hypothetical protein [Tanacetum cinerariifolium]
PQFPFNYESEPGYIENYNSYPYDSSSFPQQEPCCEDCGGSFRKSLLNRYSTIISSSLKIDSFLDEFAGELTLFKSIPSGIDKTDCYTEEDIHLAKRLLYDNSSPHDPMPPSIEDDDDDSERDILILEELLDNYSLSLPENESFRFDIPSFSRPHAKPPDGNTGILNIKMIGDISEQKFKYGGNWIKLSDLKQALRGGTSCLSVV